MFAKLQNLVASFREARVNQDSLLRQSVEIERRQLQLNTEQQESKIVMGRILSELQEARYTKSQFTTINDFEFKIFSQFGDDGIIQFLINRVKPANTTFI